MEKKKPQYDYRDAESGEYVSKDYAEQNPKTTVREKKKVTASGKPPKTAKSISAPTDEKLPDGQLKDHWILSDEERAKGFVRPVRTSYIHIGKEICAKVLPNVSGAEVLLGGLREVCVMEPGHKGECIQFRKMTQYEHAVAEESHILGGCGRITTMGQKIAETYAAEPEFYGSTFCANCHGYFPVGKFGEFKWVDEKTGQVLDQKVGV